MNPGTSNLPAPRPSGLARYVPLLEWLPRYDRASLRPDLVAGLTTWALVVPQAIAYSQIAGLPPQAGLYTAFAALLGYGLFGTSRQLVVSPASATAAVSAALVGPLAAGDPLRFAALSALLALVAGALFIVYGWLRLGFVSQFIVTSVQTGLMFGLGLQIIAGQVPKLLGTPGGGDTFLGELAPIVRHLGETNLWTLGLGAASLALLLALKRAAPRFPAMLVVVAASILLVTVLGLPERGVEVLGHVDANLPLPAVPRFGLGDVAALLPGAVAISLIGYAESDAVAEEFASRHRYEVAPNQELLALGAANFCSGLFQGFIVAGGASQSATNDRAGARTQLSGLIVSALVLLTAALLMPMFANLAQAVLGAIVISAVLGFINVRELRRIRALRRDAFWLAVVALLGVVTLGVLPGLLLALFISFGSMLVYLAKIGTSELGRLPEGGLARINGEGEAHRVPGLLIVRLDGPLLAINASGARLQVRERVRAASPPVRVALFDLQMTPDLDIESIDTLLELQRDLAEQGVELWLADLHGAARAMLPRSGLGDALGEARIFPTVGAGVDAYKEHKR